MADKTEMKNEIILKKQLFDAVNELPIEMQDGVFKDILKYFFLGKEPDNNISRIILIASGEQLNPF